MNFVCDVPRRISIHFSSARDRTCTWVVGTGLCLVSIEDRPFFTVHRLSRSFNSSVRNKLNCVRLSWTFNACVFRFFSFYYRCSLLCFAWSGRCALSRVSPLGRQRVTLDFPSPASIFPRISRIFFSFSAGHRPFLLFLRSMRVRRDLPCRTFSRSPRSAGGVSRRQWAFAHWRPVEIQFLPFFPMPPRASRFPRTAQMPVLRCFSRFSAAAVRGGRSNASSPRAPLSFSVAAAI